MSNPFGLHPVNAAVLRKIDSPGRGTIVYLFILMLMRALRREPGTVSIADLLMVVLIVDASQNAMSSDYHSVLDGLILVLTIVFWNFFMDWLASHSKWAEQILYPPPLPLFQNRKMNRINMRRQYVTRDQLFSMVREHGIDVLLFGASGVFVELQDALDTIWKVQPKEQGLKGLLRGRFTSLTAALGTLLPSAGFPDHQFSCLRNESSAGCLDEVAHVTAAQHEYKVLLDLVRLQAITMADKIKVGHFSLWEPGALPDNDPSIIVVQKSGLLRVKPGHIDSVKNTQNYYAAPVGVPWKYSRLDASGRFHGAQKFKELLADSQARPPVGKVALALAESGLPYFRQRLDTRPLLQHIGPQGSGKTHTANRVSILLYGEPTAQSATEAALRRCRDPLIILDDMESMPHWLKDHLRTMHKFRSTDAV